MSPGAMRTAADLQRHAKVDHLAARTLVLGVAAVGEGREAETENPGACHANSRRSRRRPPRAVAPGCSSARPTGRSAGRRRCRCRPRSAADRRAPRNMRPNGWAITAWRSPPPTSTKTSASSTGIARPMTTMSSRSGRICGGKELVQQPHLVHDVADDRGKEFAAGGGEEFVVRFPWQHRSPRTANAAPTASGHIAAS